MPRKTAIEEASKIINQFFEETKAGLIADITSTRQPGRRKHLLRELDVFDKVHARAYHWLTSKGLSNG